MKLICYLVVALACAALNAGAGAQSPNAAVKPSRTMPDSSDLILYKIWTAPRSFIPSGGHYERPDLLKTAIRLCSADWHNHGRTGQAAKYAKVRPEKRGNFYHGIRGIHGKEIEQEVAEAAESGA